MTSVLLIVGTRPEAIKMAPVYLEMAARPDEFDVSVCATAQHRQMLDQVLRVFDIVPRFDLDAMRPGQTLNGLVPDVMRGLGTVFEEAAPDLALVQGDTSSAFAGAMAAFHLQIPVAHVEAGLRTYDKRAPFPEEGNRRLISSIADLHFPPTRHAAANLAREGVGADSMVVTGNTVIDALFWVLEHAQADLSSVTRRIPAEAPWILVTGHRRESFGEGFRNICRGLRAIAETCPTHQIIYPVHLNPNVRDTVLGMLGDIDNIHLLDPMDYVPFVHLMRQADFIISDSGGIQEEATALGKPVLVMREVTERPEAVKAGICKLVGTDPDRILREATALAQSRSPPSPAARKVYGDGHAAKRIADAIAQGLHLPRQKQAELLSAEQ
ncbi:UDP-N-Acetylglucosamine 2-epimerase [Tranquillimonas rosea]|uniref:UDP-N-acetylglucosamine 2-epimerase (non-hydrolyzing) n=1 Tax=Tranquillimonas rosea TaxID=641238 RepID=A0A1H9TQA1_9RHOB|nr:UDP-N-acetylglucosamine 2-epimerase (non-hydrolyzing) [Tranquillimonas rosea]SER99325.1 UDP-N-Acetylglucosamine 2-epimerase [Tranquillimonas rosea]